MNEQSSGMEKSEQNRKPRRSWIRTTLWFLLFIFAVNLALQVYMNANYIRSITQKIEDDNRNAVHIFARTVDTELGAINENLHELLIQIYNKTELRSGSEQMTAALKSDIYTTMTNKLISNPRIDFFCLEDSESDLYLFNANSLVNDYRKIRLKRMAAEYTPGKARPFRERSWDVVTDSGEVFLFKSVRLGKYILTTGTAMLHYPISEIAVVSGDNPILLFETDEGTACFDGADEEEMQAIIDADGNIKKSGKYLRSDDEMRFIDGRAVLLVERSSLQKSTGFSNPILLMGLSLFSLLLLLLFYNMLNYDVIRPTRSMMAAISEVQKGNFGYQIAEDMKNREFQEFANNFNEMSHEIETAQEEQYTRLKKEEEDRLHLLRAQIKPHFYLNAITTISNMTYQGRQEDIRKYCQVLAKYMRYMLEMKSDFTTVGEELKQIEDYITMQQIRFPGSVTAETHCDPEVRDVQLPLLVMFTIVENSFKHAMDLYKELHITISCRKSPEGCRIRIADDGPGFPEEVLENRNDTDTVFKTRNHIGLSNAAHTLRLTYRRPDLLVLSNLPEGGACADILIPNEIPADTENGKQEAK